MGVLYFEEEYWKPYLCRTMENCARFQMASLNSPQHDNYESSLTKISQLLAENTVLREELNKSKAQMSESKFACQESSDSSQILEADNSTDYHGYYSLTTNEEIAKVSIISFFF